MDLRWMLRQSDRCLKQTLHPQKLGPCVEDLDATHASYLLIRGHFCEQSPGHECYITSPPLLRSSAVKIAPVFLWGLCECVCVSGGCEDNTHCS